MEKLNKILQTLKAGFITIDTAQVQILDLFGVTDQRASKANNGESIVIPASDSVTAQPAFDNPILPHSIPTRYVDTLVDTAKTYALRVHEETNHKYDGKPYSTHLQMVYDYACKYSYLLFDADSVKWALASAWTHGLTEDCRQTYNDVKKVCGPHIAEITFALENEKGRTRKERAGPSYYEGIRNTPVATYVKICDRLANVKYSKETGSSMLETYKKEHPYFEQELFDPELAPMWIELSELLFDVSFEDFVKIKN